MSILIKVTTAGLDLACQQTNSTGFATLKNKKLFTCHLYKTDEIIKAVTIFNPKIIAIDAPLSLPKKGNMRNADKLMNKKGYRVFPPLIPTMKKLTLRAAKIKETLERKNYQIIEVHPTSTCKALHLPKKDWGKIQEALQQMGFRGELTTRKLSPHEIDAAIAALTAYLHLQGKTELIGDKEEGYIIVPQRKHWSKLRI